LESKDYRSIQLKIFLVLPSMKNILLILLVFIWSCTDAQLVNNNILIQKGIANFEGITNVIYTGDSFMAGQNASPLSNCYRQLLTGVTGFSENNLSTGGRGVWAEINAIHSLTWTRSTMWNVESAGLNDLRRSHRQSTFNKIGAVMRTYVKKCFSNSVVYGGSTSVTRAGTWNGFAYNVFGGASVTNVLGNIDAGAISSAANSTLSWSFSGDNVWVCFSASDSTISRSDVEVRIDGILIETITDLDYQYDGVSDGSYDNKRGPDTRFWTGLGQGAHTIELKALQASSMCIDNLGTLGNLANAGILFVMAIPEVIDYSKPGLDQANNTIIAQGNAIKVAVIQNAINWGYGFEEAVFFIPVMDNASPITGFYDLTTGCDPVDNVHPNNTGHSQFYQTLLRWMYNY
jgi:hypothetical protein